MTKLPFNKEAYFKILDTKLNQPIVPQGGTVIDRLLAQTAKYTASTTIPRN